MEQAHEQKLTALSAKHEQELSTNRASWAKKEESMKAIHERRMAAMTSARIARRSWSHRWTA
eukprot:764568-Hanusia_phi.AAC.3